MEGKEAELPKYNFFTGMPEKSNHKVKLYDNNVLIMEGIHGLNDKLTEDIDETKKYKIYISALGQINLDFHNRIPTTDCRLIRRIVRDKNFRGYTAEETLERWHTVREGEEKYIFPFQENADVMFNSGLTYELGVLRNRALINLEDVSKYSHMFTEAKRLILLLQHFEAIDERDVPWNSILKEFLGGSVFNY